VLDYSRAQGWRTGENPARWKGYLENLLARRPKLAQTHHAAMAYGDVPQFIQKLRTQEALAAPAFQFLILTAARLSEVTGAIWVEMDCEAGVWTIPAARMKAGREHRVPLSHAAREYFKGRQNGAPQLNWCSRVVVEGGLSPAQPFGRFCRAQPFMDFVRRLEIGVPRPRISRESFANKLWDTRSAMLPSSPIAARIGSSAVEP
jgi:integrase